jgi:hypothetical protein
MPFNPSFSYPLYPTEEQAVPGRAAWRGLFDTIGSIPKTRDEAIKRQLANELSRYENEIKRPYAEHSNEFAGADLAYQKTKAPDAYSQMALREAQRKTYEAELPWIGTKHQVALMNAATRNKELVNAVTNNFRQFTQTPQGLAILKNDPRLADAIYQAMINQAQDITGQQFNDMPGAPQPQQPQQRQAQQEMPSLQEQLGIGNSPANTGYPYTPIPTRPETGETSSEGQMLVDRIRSYLNKESGQEPEQPEVAQAPPDLSKPQSRKDIIKDIQDSAADQYVKLTWPPDVKKRLYAGDRFKATVPMVIQNFELAKEYFSPQGRKLLLQDIKKGTGKNAVTPPRYQAYKNFVQGIEQLNVQGAFLEGVPADQISRGQYHKVFDIDTFFNNPESAQQTLETAINLGLQADEANRSRPGELVERAPKSENTEQPSASVAAPKVHQLKNGDYLVVYSNGTTKEYTKQGLEETAKANNISVTEVKRRLGITK